jgi:hypothetical protein
MLPEYNVSVLVFAKWSLQMPLTGDRPVYNQFDSILVSSVSYTLSLGTWTIDIDRG